MVVVWFCKSEAWMLIRWPKGVRLLSGQRVVADRKNRSSFVSCRRREAAADTATEPSTTTATATAATPTLGFHYDPCSKSYFCFCCGFCDPIFELFQRHALNVYDS